jgi:hypothetical protein
VPYFALVPEPTSSKLGSIIIALNGPSEPAVGLITDFQKLFLAPGFLAYGGTLIAASFVIVLFVIPKCVISTSDHL